jgi:hypothetical protein
MRYKRRRCDNDLVYLNGDVLLTSEGQDVRTALVSSRGAAAAMGRGLEAEPPATLSPASILQDNARTVGTVDYDYAAAFRGGADRSLSDVPHGPWVDTQTKTAATPAGSGNKIFSYDPTFDQAYVGMHEVLLDVYAPAGKLGVIIDTPGDGALMIHFIKEGSSMAKKVRVGFLLVAVDDNNVRAMPAVKMSKLISTKAKNLLRKFTIIRQERGSGPIG